MSSIKTESLYYLEMYTTTCITEIQTKAKLKLRIVEAWENLEDDVLTKLVESIPYRLVER